MQSADGRSAASTAAVSTPTTGVSGGGHKSLSASGRGSSGSSFDATNFGTPIVGRGREGIAAVVFGGPASNSNRRNSGAPEHRTLNGNGGDGGGLGGGGGGGGGVLHPAVSPSSPVPAGTFSGARVGSMRIGGGSIAGFAALPGSAKQPAGGGVAGALAGAGGSRPPSLRTAPPSPLPPAGPQQAG